MTGTLFDHNFVLNKEGDRRGRMSFAARVESGETNGRYRTALTFTLRCAVVNFNLKPELQVPRGVHGPAGTPVLHG